jgi:hypothetical protein
LRRVLSFGNKALELLGFFGAEGDDVLFHPPVLRHHPVTTAALAVSTPPTYQG